MGKIRGASNGIIEENNVFTLELHVKTKKCEIIALEEDIFFTSTDFKFLVPPQQEYRLFK